jgi:hypothetical protein
MHTGIPCSIRQESIIINLKKGQHQSTEQIFLFDKKANIFQLWKLRFVSHGIMSAIEADKNQLKTK